MAGDRTAAFAVVEQLDVELDGRPLQPRVGRVSCRPCARRPRRRRPARRGVRRDRVGAGGAGRCGRVRAARVPAAEPLLRVRPAGADRARRVRGLAGRTCSTAVARGSARGSATCRARACRPTAPCRRCSPAGRVPRLRAPRRRAAAGARRAGAARRRATRPGSSRWTSTPSPRRTSTAPGTSSTRRRSRRATARAHRDRPRRRRHRVPQLLRRQRRARRHPGDGGRGRAARRRRRRGSSSSADVGSGRSGVGAGTSAAFEHHRGRQPLSARFSRRPSGQCRSRGAEYAGVSVGPSGRDRLPPRPTYGSIPFGLLGISLLNAHRVTPLSEERRSGVRHARNTSEDTRASAP